MMTGMTQPNDARTTCGLRARSGFTIIEMIIAVTITTVITLALTAVFGQVQRAFRAGIQQVDVFEGGRASLDLVAQDLEQMVTLGDLEFTNFWTVPFQPGMYNTLGNPRENTGFLTIQQEALFFQEYNDVIKAVGYRLIPDQRAPGIDYEEADDLIRVVRVFRFETSVSRTALRFRPNETWAQVVNAFLQDPLALPVDANVASVASQFQEVLGGVVHFRVIPQYQNGRVWDKSLEDFYYQNRDPFADRDIEVDSTQPRGGPAFTYAFSENALPAYVELEIGVMEPAVLDEWRSIAEANMQGASNFIRDESSKIHMFRRRMAIGGMQ